MSQSIFRKTALYLLVPFAVLSSCSKKEGCNFNEALNYDQKVVIDDGSCVFTDVTFYANVTDIDGEPIDRVEIKIDGEVAGSFSGRPLNGICGDANTYVYNKDSGVIEWSSTIYFSDETKAVITRSGTVSTSPDIACIEVNALI